MPQRHDQTDRECVIVTGGAGFIGSALVRHLIAATAARVVVVDKLTYAASLASLKPVSHSPRLVMEKADICDGAAMARLFARHRPDAVMHLAAETHVDRSIGDADDFIATNIVGTYTLLDAARQYWAGLEAGAQTKFRFLHCSTDEVYGSLGPEGLFREDTAYDPSSPYSASKAGSDHLALAWHRTHGLPVVISNCSNNYGPCQFPEKLIPLMILNALEGRPLPVYGDGSNVRDWLYVDDHVRAMWDVLNRGRPGEKYNIGGGNERTNLQVVRAICDLVDARLGGTPPRRHLVRFVTDRPGHDQRYAIDAQKITRELGWRAQETFETGLALTVDWYLGNRDWWQPIREGSYRGDRLGLPGVSS